jgi:small subunit ribosomal protein S21
MLIINVKDHGSIERALKELKKKFEKTKTLRELRDHKEFKKPSETRRGVLIKAKRREQFKDAN